SSSSSPPCSPRRVMRATASGRGGSLMKKRRSLRKAHKTFHANGCRHHGLYKQGAKGYLNILSAEGPLSSGKRDGLPVNGDNNIPMIRRCLTDKFINRAVSLGIVGEHEPLHPGLLSNLCSLGRSEVAVFVRGLFHIGKVGGLHHTQISPLGEFICPLARPGVHDKAKALAISHNAYILNANGLSPDAELP